MGDFTLISLVLDFLLMSQVGTMKFPKPALPISLAVSPKNLWFGSASAARREVDTKSVKGSSQGWDRHWTLRPDRNSRRACPARSFHPYKIPWEHVWRGRDAVLLGEGLHVFAHLWSAYLHVFENGRHFAKLLFEVWCSLFVHFHGSEERALFHVMQELSLRLHLLAANGKVLV